MPCIRLEALAGIVPLYPASVNSWTRMAIRFFSLGGVSSSSMPKRIRTASSTTSRRFVAPITQIPSSLPENSAKNALVTSWETLSVFADPLWPKIASSSSIKRTQGLFRLAVSQSSRTAAALSPRLALFQRIYASLGKGNASRDRYFLS